MPIDEVLSKLTEGELKEEVTLEDSIVESKECKNMNGEKFAKLLNSLVDVKDEIRYISKNMSYGYTIKGVDILFMSHWDVYLINEYKLYIPESKEQFLLDIDFIKSRMVDSSDQKY
jgi:hypothetical protein